MYKKTEMNWKKIFSISIAVLITVVSIFFIIRLVDFGFFFDSIKNLNFFFILTAVFSLLVSYYFRVLRIELLLDIKNKKIQLFSVSSIHYFLNKILPARSGELALPFLLKKHLKYDYSYGFTALIFARILDFVAMIFLLLISALLIKTQHIDKYVILFFSAACLLVFFLVWLFSEKFLNFLLSKFNKKNKNSKLKTKIISILEFLHNYKKTKSSKFLLHITIISLLNWTAIYFYYFFIVASFNLDLNYWNTTFAASISNFTFMLPNSVGNIGPFEGAWAIGFYLIGISKDISVPIGLFANVFAILLTAVFAFFGVLFLKKKV